MRFHDDMTYIKQELVDRGLMRIVPYQIRLDRFFTDEEMAANRAYAESHNNAEWSVRCDEMQKRIATENLALMEFLEKYFTFGQYKEPYRYGDKSGFGVMTFTILQMAEKQGEIIVILDCVLKKKMQRKTNVFSQN